jgi:hypothetical protein
VLGDAVHSLRNDLAARVRTRQLRRQIGSFPHDATVPLERSDEVLLLASRLASSFQPQLHVAELAFAHELAERGRSFAASDRPDLLFGKSIVWFLPNELVAPRLWDYSRQVREFAAGLERQGNSIFCSARELELWENKGHMHGALEVHGVPTPATSLLRSDTWSEISFELEPVLLKEEHSAGSHGIHHFDAAEAARRFVADYRFRPGETLVMQEVVPDATKDLRVTMVGDRLIPSATFWRQKPALGGGGWTTTATTYGSRVTHGDVPDSVEPFVADCLRRLGLRTAGVDLMWAGDDTAGEPLVLEFSPYYQPNPPKPARYDRLSYKQYKHRAYGAEGYLPQQYLVFREIARAMLDQELLAPPPVAAL